MCPSFCSVDGGAHGAEHDKTLFAGKKKNKEQSKTLQLQALGRCITEAVVLIELAPHHRVKITEAVVSVHHRSCCIVLIELAPHFS